MKHGVRAGAKTISNPLKDALVNIKRLSLVTLLLCTHLINGSEIDKETRLKRIAEVEAQRRKNEIRRYAEKQKKLKEKENQQLKTQEIATLRSRIKDNTIEPHDYFFEGFIKKIVIPKNDNNLISVAFNPKNNDELEITASSRLIQYNNKQDSPTFKSLTKDEQPSWKVDRFCIKDNVIDILNQEYQHVVTLQFLVNHEYGKMISTACIYDNNKKIAIAFKPIYQDEIKPYCSPQLHL